MDGNPLRVIVVARDQRSFVQESWRELSSFLAEQEGVVVVAEEVTRDLQLDGLDADLVIVLGGAGAILRACRKLGWRQLPLLGLNLGRLGFLAHLTPEGFYQSFPMLRDRQYQVVNHLMFECIHRPRNGEPQTWPQRLLYGVGFLATIAVTIRITIVARRALERRTEAR